MNLYGFASLVESYGFKKTFTHHDDIRGFSRITYTNPNGLEVVTHNSYRIEFEECQYGFSTSDIKRLIRAIKLSELIKMPQYETLIVN